jgi:RND family efflux transporter MFP subunit
MFALLRLARAPFRLVLPCLWLLGCDARAEQKPPAPAAREVEVLTVTPSMVRDANEYLGTVLSRQSVNIVPQVSGYVKQIPIRPGQLVSAGDKLVELDARQERAALESADAQQRAAAAAEQLALRTYERTQALHREGLVAAQELDLTEAESKSAEAQRRAAAARFAEQRVAVGFHAVQAPVAGTVGDVLVRVGDFVTASTPLTSITQGTTLEVEVRIPPERARLARPGTPVELLGADGKSKLTTSLYFVSPEADPRTQLVTVNAIFTNEIGLRPSELVRVRIVYGTSQALQVPVLAIVRQSGQAFVYGVEQAPSGPIVRRRPVSLGVLSDQSYVVTKGLTANDRVAVSSLQLLRDGAPIKPKPKPTAATPSAP